MFDLSGCYSLKNIPQRFFTVGFLNFCIFCIFIYQKLLTHKKK